MSKLPKKVNSNSVDQKARVQNNFDEGIIVKGAREHNLKNISVTIPRNKVTVFTGLSGSGKSSLAFDTVYAEGQRRYVESLSAYARNFLEQLKKPDVDSVTGLSPAIAIDQKTVGLNPRSTVGTITEVYDYLRLLFAKVGTPLCPEHHIPVSSQTPHQIIDDVLKKGNGAKLLVMAPMAEGKKGEFLAEFQKWFKKGFVKVKVDGEFFELETLISASKKLAKTKEHNIDLVVDQIILKDGIRHRLSESINTALSLAAGRIVIETAQGSRTNFSLHSACPKCGFSFPEMEPRLFSFNNPRGACLTCHGLGTLDLLEEEEFSESDIGARKLDKVKYSYKGQKISDSDDDEEEDEIIITACPDCHGARLKKESLNVKIEDKNIAELSAISIVELNQFISKIKWSEKNKFIADKITKQIIDRLNYLDRVGTSYLSLSRQASTLSGGEAQRIRLATQVGSALIGCMYVMDEPSIGLHPRDHHRLLEIIQELKERGNTIILVEHDEDTIMSADFVVDLGPRAGKLGGEIMAQGTPQELMANPDSMTGQYLSRKKRIAMPKVRRQGNGHFLKIIGATGNNLQNVNLTIPLGKLSCITGVSGSGKSTLIIDTLYKILAKHFYRANVVPANYKKVEGLDQIDKVIDINQRPIGRTPRSTPATYVGLLPIIRELYAALPDSKLRGFPPGRFSFNVKGGRCETCMGHGQIKMEMHFLSDVYVTCDTCNGKRYNRETLQIKFKDKNIDDVLKMNVEEALEFFKNHSHISRKLQTLQKVGLDYMTLGQASTTLSGGEAQRVKLSKELSKRGTGKTLYILDEPTTGLHFDDVRKLVELLQELTDQGNTVLIIEHNMEVAKTADHIVDLGPDGGIYGGHIVAEGTPEQIIKVKNSKSITADYLKRVMVK
ncbi:MAG: excinuclease ABC subunit UvrA [Moraxellaceae bacterium]|nr:excinuclease ABC subunit UvrA [Pseudobdellovibrionaceae bacterium]